MFIFLTFFRLEAMHIVLLDLISGRILTVENLHRYENELQTELILSTQQSILGITARRRATISYSCS